MAIAMVAMLAFGGTYAYFSASADESYAGVKMAVIEVAVNEESLVSTYTEPGDVVPGAWIYGAADDYSNRKINATATTETYVFVSFSAKAYTDAQNKTEIKFKSDAGEGLANTSILNFAIDTTSEVFKNGETSVKWAAVDTLTDVYYITVPAQANAETAKELTFKFKVQVKEEVYSHHGETTDNFNTTADTMGATIEVTLAVSAIQTFGQGSKTLAEMYTASTAHAA